MKTILSVLALATAATTAWAKTETPIVKAPIAPVLTESKQQERYIVLFHPDESLLSTQEKHFSQQALIQKAGGKFLHALSNVNGAVVMLNESQGKQLTDTARVRLIERDQPRELAGVASTAYGVTMVQALLVADAQSANQKICIIDTGYDAGHEDLPTGSHITGEVSNTLTHSVDLGTWYQDAYGHGTHVAGTIAALGNNVGLEGILPSGLVNLHNVKVIHNPNYWRVWASDIIAGLNSCEAAGANIVNMSIAGTKSSVAEEEAMQSAYDAGMLLVAAAGNKGDSQYFYPASYGTVIGVGAVDSNKKAWMFTQENDQIELVAPGVSVRSTIPNNGYRAWDGTSVATPHVSGVAALLWSHFPSCTNKQIRKVLTDTAEDLGDTHYDRTYGHGLVQAQAAFDKLTSEGCATGNITPRDIIEHVSGPSSLQSCGEGCFDLWIGQIGDNYWAGTCKVYEQAITVRVSDPKAITSAVLNYTKWDDYMQVWLNTDKVWAGPNNNFPPETAGACELSTSWQVDPNVNVTTSFTELDPDEEIAFKIRVSVTGRGEGYAKIRIRYQQ